jgi:hypothetical protein
MKYANSFMDVLGWLFTIAVIIIFFLILSNLGGLPTIVFP